MGLGKMFGGARKTIRRALGGGKKRAGVAKRSSTRKTRGRKTRGRKCSGGKKKRRKGTKSRKSRK
jgi:hypothetical protein